MRRKIFPKEIIYNSSEANFQKHSVHTKLIYTTTILFIIGGLCSLPFVYVDVSIRSTGVIKPVTDKYQLTSLVSGKIKRLLVKENKAVVKGQIIAILATPLLDEKLNFNVKRQHKINLYLKDLILLQHLDSASVFSPTGLATPKYLRSLLQFQQQVQNAIQKVIKVKREFERDKQLYNKDLISKAAFEKSNFELRSSNNDLKILFERQKNQWQSQQITYEEELNQLKSQEEQLKEEQTQYIIRAPISGTIQNFNGAYEGSILSPTQILAEISPDTSLIAECYVPPKNIGLIKESMKARFQVSAFDYREWGLLKGKVQEIANDVTLINNQPVFVVRSKLNRTYLELKNGYKGQLRKGMTIQARFHITRRSLYQLLYNNVSDWLNPNWGVADKDSQQASI